MLLSAVPIKIQTFDNSPQKPYKRKFEPVIEELNIKVEDVCDSELNHIKEILRNKENLLVEKETEINKLLSENIKLKEKLDKLSQENQILLMINNLKSENLEIS